MGHEQAIASVVPTPPAQLRGGGEPDDPDLVVVPLKENHRGLTSRLPQHHLTQPERIASLMLWGGVRQRASPRGFPGGCLATLRELGGVGGAET